MANYYISPSEQTDLQIDPAELTRGLRESWPDAAVLEVSDPESNRLLEWRVGMEHGEVEGSLDRTRQAVRVDGDLRDCAQFALWLRQRVPEKYTLIFYDEGFTADIELRPQQTPEQIAESFV